MKVEQLFDGKTIHIFGDILEPGARIEPHEFLLVLSIWPATRPTDKKLSKARAKRRRLGPLTAKIVCKSFPMRCA
ncbi:MAG: hypothetical protein AUH18_03190 [Candidatus Rokubacteria bacterium 13_2_20CM_69_10]|nr:MAG: hypothetical protein AUH18_03190 [Candidatus Rokubacteria bacterium 13_2_20CM_69_10]